MNTGNPFWFLPFQPVYRPSRVIIHYYGQATELRPADEGFDAIEEALTATLSDFQNRDLVSIGIGEQTLATYYNDEFVLEAFYGQDVEFNLPIRLRGINTLLFPIDARHAERNYVFIGNNREYRAGALQVASREALDTALAELGFPPNDQAAKEHEIIFISAGQKGTNLGVPVAGLVQITGAIIIDTAR